MGTQDVRDPRHRIEDFFVVDLEFFGDLTAIPSELHGRVWKEVGELFGKVMEYLWAARDDQVEELIEASPEYQRVQDLVAERGLQSRYVHSSGSMHILAERCLHTGRIRVKRLHWTTLH